MKCLLIETQDKKRFFTAEENLPQLIEFSKTFNAEISTVNLENGEILQLEELAPAICDPQKQKSRARYELIETMIPSKSIKRTEIIKTANKIQNYIKTLFLNNEVVKLEDLRDKFVKFKLTDACLCNHITTCKKHLEREGHKVNKIGGGKYKLEK